MALFGPADFATDFSVSRESDLTALFGSADPDPENLRRASPVTHATPDDPPFLLMHGDRDAVVPMDQSILLRDRLQEAGVAVRLITVRNAGHGLEPDGGTMDPDALAIGAQIGAFFTEHLGK